MPVAEPMTAGGGWGSRVHKSARPENCTKCKKHGEWMPQNQQLGVGTGDAQSNIWGRDADDAKSMDIHLGILEG